MKAHLTLALLAGLLGSPAPADTLDDSACGAIAEYAMDLAYDLGAPMEQQPDGQNAAMTEGCMMSNLLIIPEGPSSMLIERIIWRGEGLTDWVAGKGWPSEVSVTVEGAHMWANIPHLPSLEWANRITARRSAVSGSVELTWDKSSGILSLDLLEGGGRNNWVRLSGLASGIVEGPFQRSIPRLRLHEFDANLSFDGMFETLFLIPLATALSDGQDDPEQRFAAWITLVQSYITALPTPQVDVPSKLDLGLFMDALPEPTGRLHVTFKADSGVQPIAAVPLVAQIAAPTPEAVSRLIERLLGEARVSVKWRPGPRH